MSLIWGGTKTSTLWGNKARCDDDTPILLPATVPVLQCRQLKVEMWYQDDVSEVLVGVVNTSLARMMKSDLATPVRFTLPLLRRGLERCKFRGLISFTVICTEISASIKGEHLDAVTALASCSAALILPPPLPLCAKVLIKNLRMAKLLKTGLNINIQEVYCMISVGGNSLRTTIKTMVENECHWAEEAMSINTDFDELTSNLIQLEVLSHAADQACCLLGFAEMHLTPRRSLCHTGGLSGRTGPTPAPHFKQVALRLKAPGHTIFGIIKFDIDILVEDGSEVIASKVERAGPALDAVSENDHSTAVPPRTIPSDGNDCCIGDVIYACVDRLDDDEIDTAGAKADLLASQAGAPTIIPSGRHFLIGLYDDDAALAESKRRCQPFIPRDRNELRVIVLRARSFCQKSRRGLRRRSGTNVPRAKEGILSGSTFGSGNEASNPFVSLCVHRSEDLEPQKTSVAHSTLEPEWGEQFILPVYEPVIGDSDIPCLELTLQNYNEFASHDFMGRALFPLGGAGTPDAFNEGSILQHWFELQDEMGDAPNPTDTVFMALVARMVQPPRRWPVTSEKSLSHLGPCRWPCAGPTTRRMIFSIDRSHQRLFSSALLI